MAGVFAACVVRWGKAWLYCGMICLALCSLDPGRASAQTVNAHDDGTFSDALDEVNAGNADAIAFDVTGDTTITPPAATLSNAASFINDSGYAVRLFDTTNGRALSAASGVTLDFSGASPLSISASGTGYTDGVNGAGALNIASLGANTTVSATSTDSGASGLSSRYDAIDIGTLSGTVSAMATNSIAYGLDAGDDLSIGTLSGTVSATGELASGLLSNSDNINIDTLSGSVSATGTLSVSGLEAGSGLSIGTLSGTVNATGRDAYGLHSWSGAIAIDTLSGTVSATGTEMNVYGLDAGSDLSIGTLSGTVSATNADGNAYGLSSSGVLAIDTLSGSVSAMSTEVYAFGLYSNSGNINITTLSGTVNATGKYRAKGMYSGSGDIDISTLSGTVSATSTHGEAYGLEAGSGLSIGTLSGTVSAMGRDKAVGLSSSGAIDIGTLSGTVSAIGRDTAYGLYSGSGAIAIDTLSGSVSATSTNSNAFGLNSDGGDINIDTLSGTVSATVSATGGYHALGLYSRHGGIDIGTLSGSVSATGRYSAYGLYSGGGDINVDTLSGTVSAMSTGSNGYAYGLEAGSDLSIGTLSGTVSATSTHGYAYGLEAGNDLSIGTLSGSVSATSTGWYAYGLSSSGAIDMGTLSGAVSATGSGDDSDAYGLYTDSGEIDITTLSGAVSATGSGTNYSNAYGLYSDSGAIDIGTLSGAVNATGSGYFNSLAYGLYTDSGEIDITTLSGAVSATGSGTDYSNAYGLYSNSGAIDIGTLSGAVSATGSGNYSDAYGLYSNSGDIDITTLSGAVSATNSAGSAQGLSLNAGTINIDTLSGSVSATGTDFVSGLYLNAGAIDIGTLSGAVSATSTGYDAYGFYSFLASIDIGTLSGTVSATSTDWHASGLSSLYGDIAIGTLSGAVSAASKDYRAFGIKSGGALNGGDSATPAVITGTVSAVGGSYASAIEADGATNLYVGGTLYAEDTSGGGNAWAVKTGGADDRLTLATGSSLIGLVDLGGGLDLLTLVGEGSTNNTFQNIETMYVGNGFTPTRWTWGGGASISGLSSVDILSNAALQVGKGAVINSPVSVHAGGTLGGYGTVGSVTNSGTVSPGGSIGTLTVNGDYTQTAGGALFMELGAYTQDQLIVTGAANLDGALILVPEAGGLFRSGSSWSVLTAGGGINGKFSSTLTTQYSPTLTFLSTQTGGVLSVSTYRSTPYTAFVLGGRSMGLAQLLTSATNDATGEMAEMLAGLDFSSEAEISYAMESLSAESYDALSQSALEGGRALTAAQRAGLRSGGVAPGRTYIGDLNQGGGTSDAPKKVGGSTGMAADEAPGSANSPELTVFLEPFGMHANQGSSSDRVGYDAMTWGLAAGFLYHPTENWTLGIAPGFFSQSLQEDGPGDGDGSVVEWSVAALIGYATDDFYMDAMARLGFDSFRSNKDLVLPGMPRSADARWNGTNLTFAVGGGYDFHVGGFTFGPVGSLAWSNLHEDSFEEKDAGLLGQHIRARNSQSLNTELGARITRTFESEYGDITPELRMVWNAEWLSDERSITSSFIGYAGGRYSAQLADQRYHAGLLDAGITWAVNDRFSIVAHSSVELFRPDHDSLSGSLRLQYAF